MNKYKIVGIMDFLVGVAQVLYCLAMYIVVIPKLALLYSDMNINIIKNLNQAYTFLGFLFVLGVVSIALSFKLFSKSQVIRNKYYKTAVIILVINMFFTGILFFGMLLSTITPIYNLVYQLQ